MGSQDNYETDLLNLIMSRQFNHLLLNQDIFPLAHALLMSNVPYLCGPSEKLCQKKNGEKSPFK